MYDRETASAPLIVKRVIKGAVGMGILITLFSSFTIVPAGHRGVLFQLGAVQDRVLQEGFNWKMPFVQSVKKVNVRTMKEEMSESAASKDLQIVTTKIALNYHLEESQVNVLWQEIGPYFKSKIILPAVSEAVKAATAKYTAEELITKRQEVKDEITAILTARLLQEYVVVDQLSIVDFDFSSSFNAAIEAKVTAEQDALAAENKLEQVKFEAQQRVEQAEGEAQAIRIQANAIKSQGGKAYVDLKAIEAWDGKLPVTMLGAQGAVPFINIK